MYALQIKVRVAVSRVGLLNVLWYIYHGLDEMAKNYWRVSL